MNFRKVVLVYIVIFAWFAVYRLVFGQTEITYYAGPRLTVGPMGETYYGPMIPYGSGNSDLAGIGVIGLLLYTGKYFIKMMVLEYLCQFRGLNEML